MSPKTYLKNDNVEQFGRQPLNYALASASKPVFLTDFSYESKACRVTVLFSSLEMFKCLHWQWLFWSENHCHWKVEVSCFFSCFLSALGSTSVCVYRRHAEDLEGVGMIGLWCQVLAKRNYRLAPNVQHETHLSTSKRAEKKISMDGSFVQWKDLRTAAACVYGRKFKYWSLLLLFCYFSFSQMINYIVLLDLAASYGNTVFFIAAGMLFLWFKVTIKNWIFLLKSTHTHSLRKRNVPGIPSLHNNFQSVELLSDQL